MTLKYDDHGRPYEDLTEENKKLNSRIQQLDKSLKMALEINDNYQRDVKKLQDQVRAAEGETSIIKGIGINSPEMRAMKKEIEEVVDIEELLQLGKNQESIKNIKQGGSVEELVLRQLKQK